MRRERKKGAKNIFEYTIAENFTNLRKETHIRVQEAQRVPNRIDPKRTTPRHVIIKMAKIEDKRENIKSSKRKVTNFIQGNSYKTMS